MHNKKLWIIPVSVFSILAIFSFAQAVPNFTTGLNVSGGNVGIGNTAPSVRLDVSGGGNSYGTNIYGLWTPDGNSLVRNWALNDGSNNYIRNSGASGVYTSISDSPLGSKTMRWSSPGYLRNEQWIPVDITKTYKVSVWGRTISGEPNNYLSLTQAASDLSQPSNGGWGNPYWGVVNQPFPAAWTYYSMTIGPSGSGADYAWSATTKYVQLGALMIYTGSGVCELTGYKIEELTNTIAAGARTLGNLNVVGALTAGTISGSVSGTLNAGNVSAGAFGSSTGGGNYSFPGSVGIGVTSPAQKFWVQDGSIWMTGNGNKLAFSTDGSTDPTPNASIIATQNGISGASADLIFNTWNGSADTEIMRLRSNGNVGIGTTDPTAQMSGTNGIGIFHASYPSVGFKNNSTSWLWYGASNTLRLWNVSATEILTATSGGNVGIGTTAPGAKLMVSGQAVSGNGTVQTMLVDGAGGNGAITINSAASGHAYQTLALGGVSKFEFGVNPSGDFYLNPNIQNGSAGSAIYIQKSSGNVGINAVSPQVKLDVKGKFQADNSGSYSTTYTWAGGTIQTNSLELMDRYGGSTSDGAYPTLTFHDYGNGGAQFSMEGANTTLHLGSAQSSSAGTIAGAGSYFSKLKVYGTVEATSFSGPYSGTVNAANVSAGAFGSSTGGGSYSFPGNISITNADSRILSFDYSSWTQNATVGLESTFNLALQGHGDIIFRTNHLNAGSAGERMRITNGGNVGIGTAGPSYKLDVAGYARMERHIGINSLALGSYTTVNPASNVFLYSQPNDRDSWLYLDSADGGSNWGIYHRQIDSAVSGLPGNSIGFVGGGSSALQAYISLLNGSAFFNGNVGIGTTAPGEKLEVAGNIKANHLVQGSLVARPYATWSVAGGSTGAVIIKLPGNTGNYGMVHIEIDTYEYSGNAVTKYICGGHNWNGLWYNYNCTTIGSSDKQIRLAAKDGQYAVVIGDAGSVWSYGHVVLSKITNGGYYSGTMNLGGTYTIYQEASESYSWISGNLNNRLAASRSEGRNYIDYARYVYNNGAYSGSGWTEPSDLGVRYASSAGYATSAGSATNAGNADTVDGWHRDDLRAWGNLTSKPIGLVNMPDTGNAASSAWSLAWKNYGNHMIVDMSNSTAPNGTSHSNTNPEVNWTGTYPTLMGWNGSNTYGVRVDSARVADSAGTATNLSGGSVNGTTGVFSGNVSAPSFSYSSDRAFKNNIVTISNSLDKIMQLRGVTFNWKKDNKPNVGLIAQEVEKVFPELVSGEEGNKSVQYGNLVAPLIEAVKAQQEEIETLESRIKILETKR